MGVPEAGGNLADLYLRNSHLLDSFRVNLAGFSRMPIRAERKYNIIISAS
jgi:hypothetical protein